MRTTGNGIARSAGALRTRATIVGLVVAALALPMSLLAGGTAVAAGNATPGTLTIMAGVVGQVGQPTDGVDGTASLLRGPSSVATDAQGNIYIADFQNSVIDRLDPDGILTIFAGNLADQCPTTVTPGPATGTGLCEPDAVAVDHDGNVYIGDVDYGQIYKVTPNGTLSILVASGLPLIGGLAADSSGNVYASEGNIFGFSGYRVQKVTPSGVVTDFVGTGVTGAPVPGPALSSPLANPVNLATDTNDNLYIADAGNNVVEKVTPGGTLSIAAGAGSGTTPATTLNGPMGVATDTVGNLYVADTGNCVVDRVTPTGTITTVAGTGCGTPVDGPALSSPLYGPAALAVDPFGNLVIGDFDVPFSSSGSLIELVAALSPPVPKPTPPTSGGYWTVAADGGVFSFGTNFYGSTGNLKLDQPVVGMAQAGTQGYWFVAKDGGIFAYGAAVFRGSLPLLGIHVTNIVGMAHARAGHGYWEVGSDGGVDAFNVPFYGSLPGLGVHVNNIVGIASTPDGLGYYLVGSDGAVYAFGDAVYAGGANTLAHLAAPIVGLTVDNATGGYWEAGTDGGVYSFGAPFHGSTGALVLTKPVVGVQATADGAGYYLVASDGGIFSFNAPFFGSMGGKPLKAPMVGMTVPGLLPPT